VTCQRFSVPPVVIVGLAALWCVIIVARVAEGFLDAPLGDGVLPAKALGVDLEQDGHAVTGPLGDLCGRDAAVEPCRDACVPEVVHAACQRRGGLGGTEGVAPGLGP